MADAKDSSVVPTFCALCVSRCGALATVSDGELVSLEPDPAHPTGQALCIKGKAAPELVRQQSRLAHPLERTGPKGGDPGFRRISWERALELVARNLLAIAEESGPESVAFSCASPSTSATSDSMEWVQRLQRAFGSPHFLVSMELCGWGRYLAPLYTFGASVPGEYLPDLENAGCILYWGYNPSVTRLAHATETVRALQRGAKLIAVDPRRAGFAKRADVWLRVRPGTDGALALGLCHVMLARGWFDEPFVRRWTNAPLLVRSDDARLLRANELDAGANPGHFVAWHSTQGRPVLYDPEARRYETPESELSLRGHVVVETLHGEVTCTPVFQRMVDGCQPHDPGSTERTTGVPALELERAARLLWEARPVAYYAWSGVEQHDNASQTVRAIAQLYALTGCLDAAGGNVLFTKVPRRAISGAELLPPERRSRSLDPERPLGPGRFEFVTSGALYTAALEERPYRLRGLVGFGANLLLAHADARRGRRALEKLDFYVHADLFLTPTAQLADVVLPVSTPFESEGLRIGFEISQRAEELVQLRRPLVAPLGEARSDVQIVFALATALGLGRHFWDGDVDAGYRHQLEPSGLTLEQLRDHPAGVRVELETHHRKFAEAPQGVPRGFRTPSGKIELYSEILLEHGYPPLPAYQEPLTEARSNPELLREYPLTLTSAKDPRFLESQHRGLPSLRRNHRDPVLELHPAAARARGLSPHDWVNIRTPFGSVKARAKFNASLAEDVVCGQHGFWEACPSIGAEGFDPFSEDGANLNAILSHRWADPMSGAIPHRSYLCDVELAEGA